MKLMPFIYKETLHVFRDYRMLLVVLAIPVVMMLLFGFAISTEVNNVKVAVSWQTYNNDVRQIIERLEADPYITMVGSVPQSEIYHTMRANLADAVLLFKDGENVQVITDASNPNNAQAAQGYVSSIVTGQYKTQGIVSTHFLFNPQLKSSYNFVPGIMGMIFLLICSLMTAVSIVREKETGTMEQLLVSPTAPVQIILSKMVPFFVISCVDLALILIISIFVLDVPMSAGVLPVIVVTLIYILLALALGLFVSTVAETQVTAMLFCGMVMIFPVVMLSGMIFPVDNLPVVLREISYIVPARWYISAMRKLMVEGLTFSQVWQEIVILSGMALLLMVVAIKKFSIRMK